MRLWILEPKDDDAPPWDPWYDKTFGFVVRAETEADARRIAAENQGDEGRRDATGRLTLGTSPWLDPDLTSCDELVADGEPGVVMRDNRGA